MAEVIPLKPRHADQMTKTQEKFWKVLQEEANRTLPLTVICQKAGYRSNVSWYQAIKDETFRHRMEELGVVTQRVSRQRIVALAENVEEEWQKDSIDIRRVIAEYPKHLGACALRLDFSCIRNPTLKKLIKRYFRARVGFWEASSFCHALKDMKPFLIALGSAMSGTDRDTDENVAYWTGEPTRRDRGILVQ